MKMPALDSLRFLCLVALLVPLTAWSQASPPAEIDKSVTVKLLSAVPENGAEAKDLGETLKLNASGPTFAWAQITFSGVKDPQGLGCSVEWQIKDGADWRPLRADRPRKPLIIIPPSVTAPLSQNSGSKKPILRRLISQELAPSDKGILRVRVMSKDDKELGHAEVTLTK
jgi:hypothetical protein